MFTEHILIAACLLAAISVAGTIWIRSILSDARNRVASAERLAAARGRCLALAAQELRGPGLSLMALSTQIAPGPRRAGEEAPLEGVAQHLLRLADDLADFATEPSPRTLHEAPALLGPVIDAAIAGVAAQIRPGRRHWKVAPELRMLTVRADGRALEGALAALLRRAARHSRDGDVVALRHVLGTETIAIVVEDEGDGLPAQDMLADLPSAAKGGAPLATRGLDLGLTLARSLAAAHGGDIRLESTPGIGARAWLTLPRARLLEVA